MRFDYKKGLYMGMVIPLLLLWVLPSPAQDSTKTIPLGIRFRLLHTRSVAAFSDSLSFQLNFKKRNTSPFESNVIDLHEYMPSNHLFWDYRESSYYTPWYVKEKIARIMDRPMPSEVVPLLPMALLAARIALQKLKIAHTFDIKPQDYLLPKKYWPILKAVWQKYPRTAFDLYRIKEIQHGHTLETLKNDLDFLVDRKLLKSKTLPNQPTLYYPGQSRGKAILLIEKALQDDRYSLMQKKQWIDFRNYVLNDNN